ncbi:hypothetical protein Asp14428_13480 [Actinoplanes sp. NBRC 14428]|uniref:Polyketide cyclase/dehydrase/lipid transport protein n=1 Tax=Pseudosporangium ferrugineum TaxID=439699 RepID=A0A2T0SES0_9ACTN|nr:SRPBCC family protein [Pseudosporangium ferrugineum]PRY31891.1 polyketide cyclase/dehydrase/lipid transport protein [Pseudosporangium ferrugineum]BCJ49873.1 hypothetical protein Asp14428_13480 [Actinoplanes sp. NBRC 14428]
MSGYDVTARSGAPAEAIYELWVTPGTWPRWSSVDTAGAEGGDAARPQGVGGVRVFRTGRNVSRERITALVPGRRIEYDMLSGALRDYRAAVELTPLDGGGTAIRWSGTFRGNVVMGWYLRWYMARMARGLAAHAERVTAG